MMTVAFVDCTVIVGVDIVINQDDDYSNDDDENDDANCSCFII